MRKRTCKPVEIDVAEMGRLYQQGMSGYDLSQRFGVSNQTVYSKLKESGFAVRPQKASGMRPSLQVLPSEKVNKPKPLSADAAALKALGLDVTHAGADLWLVEGDVLNAAQVRGRLAWESRRRAA